MKNMYRIIKLTFVFVVAFAQAQINNTQQNTSNETEKYPVMTFEKKMFDLGTLNEGDVVTRVYKFTNTGNAPLIISKIRASCGCTVPSGWKKTPIMPGEKSEFTVKFNSSHKVRRQHKTITVTCNTKNKVERVSFKAYVNPNPKLEEMRRKQREINNKKRAERYKKKVVKLKKGTTEYKLAKENLEKYEKEYAKKNKKLLKQRKRLAKKQKKLAKKQKKLNAQKNKLNKIQRDNTQLNNKIVKLRNQL